MDKIRVAILGSGFIARTHARACRAVPAVELVMAANWRPESLTRFAEEWRIPRISTHFDEVAADPEIDAVINTLPNFLHGPESIRMLRAGKHVLLEKPMAMNAAEAQTVIDAAHAAGRALMVGHMWRFDNEVTWLRRTIEAGLIGNVVRTHGYHLNPPFFGPPDNWIVRKDTAGGGAVMDMAVHSIDTTRYLLGEPLPVRVYAETGTDYSQFDEVEDVGTFMVHWDNGVHSVFVTANYNPYQEAPEGAIDVWGSTGHGRIFPSVLDLKLGGVMGCFAPTFPAREQQVDYPMFQKQLEYFVDCVRSGRQPQPGGREGLIAMKVVDAVYESARSGKSVDIQW
jgi:predicted dehydrogenase